jgi:hypothetical protein
MLLHNLKMTIYAASFASLALSVPSPSVAQSRNNAQPDNPIGNFIGAIARASAKSNAKKKWSKVAPEIQQCVNTYLETRKITVDQIIAEGLSPTHEKVVPIVEMCQSVTTAQLQVNYPCNIANAKGQQVPTTCMQSHAKAVNGEWVPISRDDFLRAASNNETVSITDFETQAAQDARLAEEKRLAQEAAAKAEVERQERLAREEAARAERLAREEAARKAQEIREAEERRRFAASPEGKRRAAEAAAAANLKNRYLKFAPTMAQGFNIRNPVHAPPIFLVRTCNIVEEISFGDKGFQFIRKAPSQLARLAISLRGDETVISFSDGTILKKGSNIRDGTFIKGFGGEQFWVQGFSSYDVNYSYIYKKEIGYAEFNTTDDSGEYGSPRAGATSVIVISLHGIINSHYDYQSSYQSFDKPPSRAPTNIKYRVPGTSWRYFIGACRITFSR